MIGWLTSLPRRSWRAISRHPLITALFALASIVWLGFGLIIGGAPFFGFLWLLVIGGTWLTMWFLRRRRSSTAADATTASPKRDGLIVIGVTAVVALAILGLAQLVPYGRPQSYGKGTGEPAWATPQTRALMVRACFDCHSNEVEYPWYSRVAPVSWTVQHHIDEGRESVNYSNFATNPEGGDNTIEVIREGSMPPGYFTAFGSHPEAKLTAEEKAALIAGLEATPGFQGGERSGESREDHDRD